MPKLALLTSRDFVMYHIFRLKNPNAFYPELGRADLYPDLFLMSYSQADVNMLPTGLGNRDFCETDPRWLQLIPYIQVTRVVEGVKEYARYQRGSGSGEERLKSNFSIGFGGHIEESMFNTHKSILAGTKRELLEELKLGVVDDQIRFDYLMFDPKPGVNQVHLAIVAELQLTEQQHEKLEAGEGEEDIITKIEWRTADELLKEHQEALDGEVSGAKLEDWSLNILTHLCNPAYREQLDFGEPIYVPRPQAEVAA